MTSRVSLEELGGKSDLSDLAKGLDACIEILTEGKEGRTAWKLRRWAMALIRYVSSKSTVELRLGSVKSYFARCREFAINGESDYRGFPRVPTIPGSSNIQRRVLLHQISRVSRSLRTATPKVVTESLEAHWDLSQKAFETPASTRRQWKAFLRSRFGGDGVGRPTGVGSAASFLRRAHEGGSATEVKEITDRFRAKELTPSELGELAARVPGFISDMVTKVISLDAIAPKVHSNRERVNTGMISRYAVETVFFLYDKSSELSLEDWEVAREILFSLTACWFEIDFDELPCCRQVAVLERGFKVRVATPLEAPFRYVLSLINSILLQKLEEDPRVVSALHGNPAEMLDWTLGKRGNLVLSADLKSATDYFPQDLMHDAVEVLAENWPDALRKVFYRAVGPHRLFSANGEKSVVTSRGILMGSPVSWPLLSMLSSYLHKASGSDGWFGVCGDDYIGCHTHRTYRRYMSARDEIGAVGSPGKDILGFQSVGVFAEELVTVGRCRFIPTVSIRAVLGDPKAGIPSWSQGPEISEALGKLGLSRVAEARVCSRLNAVPIMQLRRAGIDPFAPRWVGGAGFPGLPLQTSLVRARRMMSQSSGQILKWVTAYEIAWTTFVSDADLTSAVVEDVSRYDDVNWDSGVAGEWGPVRDVVSARLGQLSWGFLLAGAAKRELRVGLSRTARAICKVNEEVTARGYWASPHERIVRGEGLVDALQRLEPQMRPVRFTPILSSVRVSGVGVDPFLSRGEPSGPWSPNWAKRKRARLV